MAFDLHVFTTRDHELSASCTLSNGKRSTPQLLTKHQAKILMEIMEYHRTMISIDGGQKDGDKA